MEVVDSKTYYVHNQSVELRKNTVNLGFTFCSEPPEA